MTINIERLLGGNSAGKRSELSATATQELGDIVEEKGGRSDKGELSPQERERFNRQLSNLRQRLSR